MWRCTLASLALAGCQLVFQLEDAGCPSEDPGPADVDFDGDFAPNGSDNCPAVANPNQADEDRDDAGDACDLCPVGTEFRDADCDGVGDSCDPDDARPDTSTFIGFNGGEEIDLFGSVAITGGVLEVRPEAESFGLALGRVARPVEGVYEVRFDLRSLPIDEADPFATIELRFANVDADHAASFAWLLYTPDAFPVARLALGAVDTTDPTTYSTTREVAVDTGEFPPGSYTLRVIVSGARARAEVFGPDGLFVTVEDPDLITVAQGTFGYVSNYAETDVAYLWHVGPGS